VTGPMQRQQNTQSAWAARRTGGGTVLLGKPTGLNALAALLRRLDIPRAEIQTACQAMNEQPHDEIRHGVNLTPAVLQRLRL
jgi:hypothetical protein